MRHLFLIIVFLCIGVNLFLTENLHKQRDENNLSAMPSLEGVPPEIAFATTALGAFRGLLVDALWLRATSMRDRGEFFELVQISDLIGKLEPRMPKIWSFNAWNLAYNISVELPTAEERWNWVQQGMNILRDKGIPYNPQSGELYEQLAWILHHKVTQRTDDYNNYYKLQIAVEMEKVMGSKSATEVKEGFPEIAKKLKDKFKLDIDFMVELEERYGKFDWRYSDSLAIYWAQKGRPYAMQKIMRNMDRITYSALQSCFRRGRIIISRDKDGNPTSLYSIPHFGFLDAVMDQFDKNIEIFGRKVGLISAYKYFLEEVVSTSYIYNNKESANKALIKLRETYPDDKKYKRPFNQLAQVLLMEAIQESSLDDLNNYIMGYLTNAYVNLAWGELEASGKMEGIAYNLYKFYEREFPAKGNTLPPFNDMRMQGLRQAHYALPPVLKAKLEAIVKKSRENAQKTK